jgi:hypothetical protein
MRKKFRQDVRYELVIQTPSNVSANDLLSVLQSCEWKFDIDLAFDISGNLVSVGTPVLKEENSDFCVRKVEADFLIDLKAWEPLDEDCYNAGDTFDFFSASPKLRASCYPSGPAPDDGE